MQEERAPLSSLLACCILAIAILAGCQTYRMVEVRGERKVVVDAATGEPVAGAEVEVLVYRLDQMAVDDRIRLRTDADGRFTVPERMRTGYALPATALQTAPRETSTWIRAAGYLPLHESAWVIQEWLLVRPGKKLSLQPASVRDALPASLPFAVQFVERGGQAMFVPATRMTGPLGLEILGVAGFRPLADVFEKCECRRKIEERLGGAAVRPVIDETMGIFVDWPDHLVVHLAFEDGSDVGAWLIGEGLAVGDFRFDHDRKDEYERLEDEAARAGRGVWGPLRAMGKARK